MARIDAFFELVNDQDGSDLHLTSGSKPHIRVRGRLKPVDFNELTHDGLMAMLGEITPEARFKDFNETGDLDFAYELPGVGRYRGNYFMQSEGASAVFRKIPNEIKTIEDLMLPPVVRRFAMLEKGLVLVTGPTGCGKTTSLASIIDHANKNRQDHIVTIEDPIEFKHRPQKCVVNHREVGRHTKSFSTALRSALREDPDIIMIGEMRDLETISLCLEAACTGHLVFATLHTPSAVRTVDRIIDVFPAGARNQARQSLADSLKGVVAQSLFERVDQIGRVAALEILVSTPACAALIREGKTYQLGNVIQTGASLGMKGLDDSIEDLLAVRVISAEEAFEKALDKRRFVKFLKNVPMEYRDMLQEEERRERAQPTPPGPHPQLQR